MKRLRVSLIVLGMAAWTALHCYAQSPTPAPSEPRFELVSVKHVGNIKVGAAAFTGSVGHQEFREPRPISYRGVKLSGEMSLNSILHYAYSPLVTPYYCESPQWMDEEVYQIEAIAPVGSTKEAVKAMLRTALVERLGLRWKLVDREKRVFYLLRGNGELKLVPSTEVDTSTVSNQRSVFKRKSASLGDLADFLAFFTGAQVLDMTEITGNYKFDEDWSQSATGRIGDDSNVAFAIAKKLGLRLEPGKQMQKTLLITGAKQEPTPN